MSTGKLSESGTQASNALPAGAYVKGCPLPEDRFVSVGPCQSTGRDITICYNTFGDPAHPCLLLIRGLGTTCIAWRDSFCQKLCDAGFYVVRYDNRDAGLSTHLDGAATTALVRMTLPAWCSLGEGRPPYTLYDMARDGLSLLTALKIERAHVLGCSMGAMIAQCMALLQPARVRSMTLLYGHSGGPSVQKQSWRMKLSFLDHPASTAEADVLAFAVRNARLYIGEYTLDEAAVRDLCRRVTARSPPDEDGLRRQMWAIHRAESRVEGLRRLRNVPTLIIHGMKDETIPFANALELARLIEGSKLVLFARMGHSMPSEVEDGVVEEVALLRNK